MNRIIICALLVSGLAFRCAGQKILVTNGSFESWTNLGSFEVPDNWPSSDLLWHFNGYQTHTVVPDAYSHSGNLAVRIAPDTAGGKIWPGFIGSKVAFVKRPDRLEFYYVDSLTNVNRGVVAVSLFKTNPVSHTKDSLGGGTWSFPIGFYKDYRFVQVPIAYVSNDTTLRPDTVSITFNISSGATALKPGHVLVDDVSLVVHNSGISPTYQPPVFSVYPNPSAGIIHIVDKYAPAGGYSIEIYNDEGRLIRASELFSDSAGELDLTALPTGMYYLKINSSGAVCSQTLMLVH